MAIANTASLKLPTLPVPPRTFETTKSLAPAISMAIAPGIGGPRSAGTLRPSAAAAGHARVTRCRHAAAATAANTASEPSTGSP